MRPAVLAAMVLLAGPHRTISMQSSMDGEGRQRRDAEVDRYIAVLETPFGGGPHQRDRERAAEWLVEHPDRAYPEIQARLTDGRAGVAVIELSSRFGREESIAPLERLLHGPEGTAWAAGQALALHPQRAAGEALERVLASPEAETAMAAADALGTRGDAGTCAALKIRIDAADARVRYHVVQAAGKVGCLQRERLEALAQDDTDADVRGLARTLLERQK